MVIEESGVFEECGFKPASDWDRLFAQIEDVFHGWRLYNQQLSGPPSWETIEASLQFGNMELLAQYWTSGTSAYWIEKDSIMETAIPKRNEKKENCDVDDQGGTIDNQQKETVEMPKAWLDMMDKSNVGEGCDISGDIIDNQQKEMLDNSDVDEGSNMFLQRYGFKDFIVINGIYYNDAIRMLLSSLSIFAYNIGCQVPLFIKVRDDSYIGILASPGFGIFRVDGSIGRGDLDSLCKTFQNTLRIPKSTLDCPAEVSARYIYDFLEVLYYKCMELPPAADLEVKKVRRYSYDYSDDDEKSKCHHFKLCTTWSDPLKIEFDGLDKAIYLDPLDAPKWSVLASFENEDSFYDLVEVPLGEILTRFLRLCSSTQTESLLSNPQITSMLKYRRIHKQRKEINASQAMQGSMEPKVRKVTSKLILKPEESVIRVESLNAILDFLFCDEELQPPQHSNGSNPSTTTTAEDDVGDNFFLPYKLSSPVSLADWQYACASSTCTMGVSKLSISCGGSLFWK